MRSENLESADLCPGRTGFLEPQRVSSIVGSPSRNTLGDRPDYGPRTEGVWCVDVKGRVVERTGSVGERSVRGSWDDTGPVPRWLWRSSPSRKVHL